jgi:hypothetical protein
VVGCGDPADTSPSVDASTGVDARLDAASAAPDGSMQDASTPDAAVPSDASLPTDASTPAEAEPPLPDAWVPPPPPDAAIGPFADAAAPCEPETSAALCARLGAECGSVDTVDLCGAARTVSCGTCSTGSRCGGVVANRCAACIAESNADFCARLGKNCGSVTAPDDCGTTRTVSCGACGANEACTAANVCACTPETDAVFCTRLGATCGSLSGADNCGNARTAACGGCIAPLTCGGGGVSNVCGSAPVCAPPSASPSFSATQPIPGPAPFAAQACASAQIGAFVDACFVASASATSCEAWRQANATCRACLVTPETSAAYGPFVSRAAFVDAASNPLGISEASVRLGVQACLDHFRAGCGATFFDHEACLAASCDGTAGCVGATDSALATCRAGATSGSCAATYAAVFAPASGACVGVLSTGTTSFPGDACLPSAAEEAAGESGQRAYLARLATAFCGP